MRRMMVDIPPKYKQLWDTWDLRGFIILSLSLQTFLILFAPLRKRTSRNRIIMPVWSAYLLADWVANFSLGLILKNQGNPDCLSSKKGDGEEELLAFWAPFLLVHLGGPDTITAFALEDNEFWLRHLIGLVIQSSATVYVFVQSLPHNRLWIPTILMIINGTIKYAERTRAFYLASAERFKWSMNTNVDSNLNYMELMDEHLLEKTSKQDNEIHLLEISSKPVTGIETTPKPGKDKELGVVKCAYCFFSTFKGLVVEHLLKKSSKQETEPGKDNLLDWEVVQYAYCLFSTFKGLVVDLVFKRRTRDQSRNFFLNQTASDAFRVVEVELNFIYLVLFTKVPVVNGHFGTISRLFSFLLICSSIGLFINVQKAKFDTIDVRITYGLLFNALALDIVALFMLLFSEKTALLLSKSLELGKKPLWKQILYDRIKQIWPIQFFKRRWSETIRTYNIIDSCLHPHSRFKQHIYDLLGLGFYVDYIKYVKTKRLTENLKDFIFDELKSKSKLVDDLEIATEISSSRGDWVLRVDDGWSRLLPYTLDGDFGQRILLWHVATNLCYNEELDDKLKSEGRVNTKNKYRDLAMLLSDYMIYLLIMNPSMMPAITSTVQIQFLDLCANIKSIFNSGKILEVRKQRQQSEDIEVDWEQLNACMKIFAIPDDVWLKNMKGDLTKSLLIYSYSLAKEVMKIEEEDRTLNKWLIISKVWVELLCYGASHSQSKVQAAQVSSGGELITIVWLMMAHFGLGDQFQINEQQKEARLLVD